MAGLKSVLPKGDELRVFHVLSSRPRESCNFGSDPKLHDSPLPSPAEHRRGLAIRVRAELVDVFLSPWSAFPRLEVPVVVMVHELPFVRCGSIEGRLRDWNHRRWLARDVREAAAIVVPSAATREDLLTLHPEAESLVTVVPHGFDPAPWEAAGAVASRGGRPYGVIVGARNARKGVAVWREALPAMRDLDLDWVVVGKPKADVPRGVRVVDDPDDAELRSLVAGARLLVYPSLSEGFGFPPLEAMASGVPVVSTTAGSIPEVVGDAALLVAPGDRDALADAIRRVTIDDALRANLRAKGVARCRAFPREASAQSLLSVLRRVANSPISGLTRNRSVR